MSSLFQKNVNFGTQYVAGTITRQCMNTQHYLMDDEWTLKTTFTSAITEQIGLDLIQREQGSTTGTKEVKSIKQWQQIQMENLGGKCVKQQEETF